jgi:hypothetical protein
MIEIIDIMGMIIRGGTTGKEKENVTEGNSGLMTVMVMVTGFRTVIEIEIENRGILIVIEIEIGGDSTYFVACRRSLITSPKIAILF